MEGKQADQIPRCGSCRAYMNCYNTVKPNNFICFFCGKSTQLDQKYNNNSHNNDNSNSHNNGNNKEEMNSAIFSVNSPGNSIPAAEAIILLVDLSPESAQCQMIHYATAAIRQALSQPLFDNTALYFFTFDQTIHEYDFLGEDIKRTIIDQSIELPCAGVRSALICDIREKLFLLLDELEEMAIDNVKNGASTNLSHCFSYLYEAVKHTQGKIFIFQAHEALLNEEEMFGEMVGKNSNKNTEKPKSILETRNKTFFDRFIRGQYDMLEDGLSIAMFVFTRRYKNMRVLADAFKLTASDLKVYGKGPHSHHERERFYYELSYLLACPCFRDVRVEFIVCRGWLYTAIYGNFYRAKERATVRISQIDPSKQIIALVSPVRGAAEVPPFCAIQVLIHYRYNSQYYLTVANILQPVSGYLDTIYPGLDPQVSSAALSRVFLSNLRLYSLTTARKKLTESASLMHEAALSHFKQPSRVPDSLKTVLQASLGMLKSAHCQLTTINNTPSLDRVIAERNYLQFIGFIELSTYFNPYLFDLTDMDEAMCREGGDFVYPPTV